MLNAEQIRAFVAVVDNESFISASKAIHKSQPAVSNAVAQLESTLGFSLFTRESYRAELTENGRNFYNHAAKVIEQLESLADCAKYISEGYEPVFRLSIDSPVALSNYMPLFNELISRFSSTRFQFFSETMSGNTHRLLSNEVDIAICVNHAPEADLDIIKLEDINMLPVCTPDFYTAQRLFLEDARQLNLSTQAVIRDSNPAKQNILSPHSAIVKGATLWTVDDMFTKKEVITGSMAWGRLPAHLVNPALSSGALIDLTRDYIPPITLRIDALRQKHLHHGHVMQALWDTLRKRNLVKK